MVMSKTRRTYKPRQKRAPARQVIVRKQQTSMSRVPETKYFDGFATSTIIQAGALNLISNITTLGPGEGQRIGSKVFLKWLQINGAFIRNQNSAYDNIRMVIFMDKQGVNTPTPALFWEPAFISNGFAPFGHVNEYYLQRYKVLSDTLVNLNDIGTGGYAFKKRVKINAPAYYAGVSTFKNQVYVIFFGDNFTSTTLPICNFTTRLAYTDD